MFQPVSKPVFKPVFPRMASLLAVVALVSLASAGAVPAQEVRRFDSMQVLQAEIADHMAAGLFSKLVDAVAPADKMSTGRIRLLENAAPDGTVPTFTASTPLFRDVSAEGMTREVTAWWTGTTYLYLGMLTHERDDGVMVLDFLLTTNVGRASRWYLTGTAQ